MTGHNFVFSKGTLSMVDLSIPLSHFDQRARELQSQVRAGDSDARARVRRVFSDTSARLAHELANFELMHAQHVVAAEHGFVDWTTLTSASGIEARLAITMARHLELNDFGIGLYRDDKTKSDHEQEAINAENRQCLRASGPAVATTVTWLLENVERTRSVNQCRTSYGMKHVAEEDIGYVTNGVFIAAGIIAGYPYEFEPNSPNVLFGMSERSFKWILQRRVTPERVLGRFALRASEILAKRGVQAFPVGREGVELAWRDDGNVRTLRIGAIKTSPFIVRLYVDYLALHVSQKVAKALGIPVTAYATAYPQRPKGECNILLDEIEPTLEWALNYDARAKESQVLPPFQVAGPYRWSYVWSERASARYAAHAERTKRSGH